MPARLFNLSDNVNKKNIVSIFLVSNAFIWYYWVLSILAPKSQSTSIWIVHFSALILSAVFGASLNKHLHRSKFLVIWMIIGIFSSTMLFALEPYSEETWIFISMLLGLSLGSGMPACISYFSDSTNVENRGRISGLTMLASGVGIAAFSFISITDFFLIGIILAIWRLSSLAVFLYAKDYRTIERKTNIPSFKEVFGQHSFILYFVPWLMFSLVNYFVTPVMMPESQSLPFIDPIQAISMGVAAVLGGFLIDSRGRKRIAMAGFVLLGLDAAVLGLYGNILPQTIDLTHTLTYFTTAVYGVSWGLFLVLFVLTVWGDLSHHFSCEKFYALGVMPFFLSKFIDCTIGSSIQVIDSFPNATLFSFTAFFLFLAVLPLVYAPETLPEKIIKDNDMKIYLEKAQKIVAKTQKDDRKKPQEKFEEIKLKFEVRQERFNKSEEPAEECY